MRTIIAKWKVDLFLVDANGRLGNITSDAVGMEGLRQEEDENGTHLHTTLLEGGMAALNTILEGGTGTWRQAGKAHGPEHRIDHVCCVERWKAIACRCVTPDSLDFTPARLDHSPVVIEFRPQSEGRADIQQLTVNRDDFEDPQKQKVFLDSMARYPVPSAALEVNEHLEHATWAFMEAAREAFPRAPHNPVKPYVTPAVLKVILFRRRIRQYTRAWRRMDASRADAL